MGLRVLELFKILWLGWNERVVHGILKAQNTFLMGIVWLLGLAPIAIAFRLLGRRLLDRAPPPAQAQSHWLPRAGAPMTMKEAARQF